LKPELLRDSAFLFAKYFY